MVLYSLDHDLFVVVVVAAAAASAALADNLQWKSC